jgi:cysteine synthase
VLEVSTGNHGRGLGHAAKEAGVRCIIWMSRLVPRNKVEGIAALGAEVRIVGDSQDDAQIEVDRLEGLEPDQIDIIGINALQIPSFVMAVLDTAIHAFPPADLQNDAHRCAGQIPRHRGGRCACHRRTG